MAQILEQAQRNPSPGSTDPSWMPLGVVPQLLICITKRLISPHLTTFFIKCYKTACLDTLYLLHETTLGPVVLEVNLEIRKDSMWKYHEDRQ